MASGIFEMLPIISRIVSARLRGSFLLSSTKIEALNRIKS